MRNPFVGLRPFSPAENELFFGRSREIAVLQSLVLTIPVLVVYAPSGTGKSSLLNAGLIPVLSQDDDLIPIRISDPRENVLGVVRQELISSGYTAAGAAQDGLAAVLDRHFSDTKRRVILVLDQFEERLKQDADLEGLYAEIARLANTRSEAATVIISIREDFLGGLERLLRRVTGLLDASYRVPPLSRAALAEAVRGPLHAVGGGITIEDDLIADVLNDLERQADSAEGGDGRIEAGYFQIVWSRLWDQDAKQPGDQLTRATYHNEGGATQIVESFVARILGELLPFEAIVLQAMIRYLVLPTGRKVALTVEDLYGLMRPEDFWPIARELVLFDDGVTLKRLIGAVFDQLTRPGAPLFRRVVRGRREEYELVHDLIGKILLNWRLQYETDCSAAADELYKQTTAIMNRGDREYLPGEIDSEKAIRVATEFILKYRSDLTAGRDSIYQAKTAEELRIVVLRFGSSYARFRVGGKTDPGVSETVTRGIRAIIPELRSASLDVSNREKARILQRQTWDLNDLISRRDYRPPVPRRNSDSRLETIQSLVQITVALLICGGTMFSLYLLGSHLFASLRIYYAPLTLGFATVGVIILYCAGYADSERGHSWVERHAFIESLWPSFDSYQKEFIHIPVWWPFIFIVFYLCSYGGAAVFKAAGWAPTAGFNAAALVAGIGLAIWYVRASELL